MQPRISSHQVAFYVRQDRKWELYHTFQRHLTGNENRGPAEQGEVAHQFLSEALVGCRAIVERTPALWLPVHLFAYGAAQALGEEEELPREQIAAMVYVLFTRCLGIPTDEATAAVRWILEHEAEATETDEPELFIENESAPAPGGGEAARIYRNLGLAQPLPRPDAALSQKERKLIIRFLILDHLIRAGKVHSSICVYRFFFLAWPKARIAVLCFGEPPDVTIRNRHEKRVHDTLIHDLRDMKQVLKEKFGMTSIRQV